MGLLKLEWKTPPEYFGFPGPFPGHSELKCLALIQVKVFFFSGK